LTSGRAAVDSASVLSSSPLQKSGLAIAQAIFPLFRKAQGMTGGVSRSWNKWTALSSFYAAKAEPPGVTCAWANI